MSIEYIRLSCTESSLAELYQQLVGRIYLQIRIKHVSDVIYIGFDDKSNLNLARKFAKANGIRFQDFTEDRMRQMHLHPNAVQIAGNKGLAERLNL